MKTIVIVLFLLLIAILIFGPSRSRHSGPSERDIKSQQQIRDGKISIGMTRSEVIQSWGNPIEGPATIATEKEYVEIWTYKKVRDRWCLLFDRDELKRITVNDNYYK